MNDKPKIVAVVGPTASGKSGLALSIAQKYNGEIVVADSRQIYKGLDIGSAKDEGDWEQVGDESHYIVDGIREHLVDLLGPNEEFTAAEFQKKAFVAIDDILSRGKLPILVGGTGLYIQSIVENLGFPNVAPNEEIRNRLKKKSIEDLIKTYESCDPVGAASIDNNNKRRLIRAIEVCMVTRKPFSEMQLKNEPKYQALQLAIDHPRESLYMRIDYRARNLVYDGLIDEVYNLLEEGANVTRSAMSGIGYREVVDYLQGEYNKEELLKRLQQNTRRLAKRQLSWFRRDATIKWVREGDEGLLLAEKFLK
ncbi:tRNA (adenosine(37)-N6)-dimethylallyltransferase MiaA [Candidatus Uhrbacteria bacterium]|jgi:tRNA dimethylallyltransferase|nr:tRNA (adenosine(37)-N6)-dimethylallyltransferase MiaA [Candidatus Uhrbacteria bacterium]